MINFHEHKLWQESFVSLMDIHDVLDKVETDDYDGEEAKELIESAHKVAATIADGLTRRDRRIAQGLIYDAVGFVAMTRTHLAVAWGRGLLDDTTFKGLDDKYAHLSEALQNYK